MEIVETCGVNGLCKLFIYEHYVVSRVSWGFFIYNLTLSFVCELDRYKRWAGLYRNADVGALRRRKHMGLHRNGHPLDR